MITAFCRSQAVRQNSNLALVFFTVLAVVSGVTAEVAPRFNARTLGGQNFDSESLKGKVVLLQFWTTWCPYCRREQPIVDQLIQEYAGQGLVVLAVNVGESKQKVVTYLEEKPRSCAIVLSEDTDLVAEFKPSGFPRYW